MDLLPLCWKVALLSVGVRERERERERERGRERGWVCVFVQV